MSLESIPGMTLKCTRHWVCACVCWERRERIWIFMGHVLLLSYQFLQECFFDYGFITYSYTIEVWSWIHNGFKCFLNIFLNEQMITDRQENLCAGLNNHMLLNLWRWKACKGKRAFSYSIITLGTSNKKISGNQNTPGFFWLF